MSEREQIAADVAAFLKSGGKIQRIETGLSGELVKYTREEVNGKEYRKAAHKKKAAR